jgi:hypothetical protein
VGSKERVLSPSGSLCDSEDSFLSDPFDQSERDPVRSSRLDKDLDQTLQFDRDRGEHSSRSRTRDHARSDSLDQNETLRTSRHSRSSADWDADHSSTRSHTRDSSIPKPILRGRIHSEVLDPEGGSVDDTCVGLGGEGGSAKASCLRRPRSKSESARPEKDKDKPAKSVHFSIFPYVREIPGNCFENF